MLPNLNDLVDDLDDDVKEEFIGVMLDVFRDLMKRDISHTNLGELLVLVGYDPDEIDDEDFDFKIDLSKGPIEFFTENYLRAIIMDKLN